MKSLEPNSEAELPLPLALVVPCIWAPPLFVHFYKALIAETSTPKQKHRES